MRATLIPGMLEMLAHNLNRDRENVRLFEMGHVYSMHGDNTQEKPHLSIGASVSAIAAVVRSMQPADLFRAFKGDLESVLAAFEYESLKYEVLNSQSGSKYYRALLDGSLVAFFGPIAPGQQGARKLKQQVFVAEVMLDRLLQQPLRTPNYVPLSRFPAVERDFSFLFDDSVTYDRIEQSIRASGIPEMRSLTPAEVFRGGSVPAGKYSMLLRASFQSNERTLRDDEVAQWSARIIDALKALGGAQRA